MPADRLVRAVAILFGAILPSVPATAQEAPTVSSEPPGWACLVQSFDGAEGQPKELRANCRGRGLMLGPVSEFAAIRNDALEATLIDARLGEDRRILLLTIQEDGQPLVEDLSGQIALAAGRGPMSEIDAVELDLARFSLDGEIGVRGRAEDTGPARTDRINLGQQVALERSRRSGSSGQN